MISKLKLLGVAIFAVLVLGAVGAQGASASAAHQFHSDGPWTIATGKNTNNHELALGAVGSVQCTEATFENTSWGSEVSAGTYETDELTVSARWLNCTFGGQPAVVFTNDCAFVVDSDTTSGNPKGGEHASVKIECSAGHKIQVHTVNCTVSVAPQTVTDMIRFENDTKSTVKGILTATNVVIGKERTTASQPVNGCLPFPTGAVASLSGTATSECFKDEGEAESNPTTPTGTKDSTTTECSITGV